jgi:hypothetical protein
MVHEIDCKIINLLNRPTKVGFFVDNLLVKFWEFELIKPVEAIQGKGDAGN